MSRLSDLKSAPAVVLCLLIFAVCALEIYAVLEGVGNKLVQAGVLRP